MQKKTKIVATVSDLKCDTSFIKELYDAGVDVIRLNTAHQQLEDTLTVIENIRKVSSDIAILVDTKGPELRTVKCSSPIAVEPGDVIKVKGNPGAEFSGDTVFVSYENFTHDVPVNSSILIDDGDVELIVENKEDGYLKCRVQNSGIIKGKKSVNVPGVNLELPALSSRDLEYIDFAIRHDIDFIAHSFVRRKSDVMEIQKILDDKKSPIKIIAKIENQEGVEKIDEILDAAFGVMIARGDLAIEIPAEKIPGIQKKIIAKCISRKKPVIIATQMLHSMIEKPRPTRAEISDVANAVFERTDALMLSGETAFGKYPLEAVKTMVKIAKEVEAELDNSNKITDLADDSDITSFLAKAAVKASINLETEGIVIDTLTGRTARTASAFRGKSYIYTECYSSRTKRELALSFGIVTRYLDVNESGRFSLKKMLNELVTKNVFTKESKIVVVAGNFGPSRGASFMEIGSVKELIGDESQISMDRR
ncbi:MAG: pyruvate kinase [Spirochaetes bacterium]|nr:pyruvate kinase [Spirochaetota bacterium]